jgi:hypothetical protein
MMGNKRLMDEAGAENQYHPSLDITLGSMEPSFIGWEDMQGVTSHEDNLLSHKKNIHLEDLILNQKVQNFSTETSNQMQNLLSLKEQEKVNVDFSD